MIKATLLWVQRVYSVFLSHVLIDTLRHCRFRMNAVSNRDPQTLNLWVFVVVIYLHDRKQFDPYEK